MSIQKIIQETIAGNPLEMKEALVEELRNRVAEALAAKMEEVELDEGLDFQNKTSRSGETTTHIYHNGKHVGTISKHSTRSNPNGSHRIQYNSDTIPAGSKGLHAHEGLPSLDAAKKLVASHVNVKEEVDQIDEISKGKLSDYMNKSHDAYKAIQQRGGGPNNTPVFTSKEKRRYELPRNPIKDNPGNTAFNKLTGRARVNATESFDLSDCTLEELEDFMTSEEFEQLDEVSRKTLASYVKKAAGADQQNTLPNAMRDRATAAAIGDKEWYKQSGRTADKRSKGIQRAADRLAKD